MGTNRSIKEFFLETTIKKEPDVSSFNDEIYENLDPQKYHYKEELDLEWDEKDNNYCAINNDDNNGKSLEKSEVKTGEGSMNSILQNRNSQPREIYVKVENPNIKSDNVCNIQKYHYKEELNLDWDEKDNDYEKNWGTVVENTPVEEKIKTHKYSKEELDLKWDEEEETCKIFVGKSTEDSQTIQFKRDESILLKRNIRSTEINTNGNQTHANIDNINGHKSFQNYDYKEELDIDWDEQDNIYGQNHKNNIEIPIEKKKVYEVEKNKTGSIFQQYHPLSKMKNIEIENPATIRDCPKCQKQLKNLNTLKKHLYYCGKAPHLQCASCSYKSKYKNALIKHIIQNHPQQIPTLKKRQAMKKVKSKSKNIVNEQQQNDKYFRFCLNCHVRTDKPALDTCNKCESWLLYQCKKCNVILHTRVEFSRHMNNICDPEGYYHCPACDYKSTNKRHVKIHLKGHLMPGSHVDIEVIKWKRVKGENGAENVFTCPNCDKQFQRKASFASHTRLCVKSQGVSKPPPRYIENKNSKKARSCELARCCTNCNGEIQSNKIRKSKCCGSSILFKCLKCNKTSEDHNSMKYHVKNVCFKIKCDLCDFEGSKIRVTAHRLYKHDFNSVECPKCKMVVKNKKVFYDHSYYCGKEPFQCNYCSFKVKRKHRLNVHVLKKHPKQTENVNI